MHSEHFFNFKTSKHVPSSKDITNLLERELIDTEKKERLQKEREDSEKAEPTPEPSFFQKNKTLVLGGSGIAAALLIWQLTKTDTPPQYPEPIKPLPTTEQPKTDNANPKPEGFKTIDPKPSPSSVTVEKPKKEPAPNASSQPPKQKTVEKKQVKKPTEAVTTPPKPVITQQELPKPSLDIKSFKNYLGLALVKLGSNKTQDAIDAISAASRMQGLDDTRKSALDYIKVLIDF